MPEIFQKHMARRVTMIGLDTDDCLIFSNAREGPMRTCRWGKSGVNAVTNFFDSEFHRKKKEGLTE